MKKTFIFCITVCFLYGGCSNHSTTTPVEQGISDSHTPIDTTDHNDRSLDSLSLAHDSQVMQSISIQPVIAGYLNLKNALVTDNDKAAAAAGKEIEQALKNVNTAPLDATQLKKYNEIANDAQEQAEHIGKSAGQISHQREHFEMLSNDVYALAKSFGAGQELFYDYCPMYNDGKGGYWMSEAKEISNPYFGKKMLRCGSVKETLK